MAITYYQSIAVCDTKEEVDQAIQAVPFVFCLDPTRECFYFNSNGVRRRVEKITSVDADSPLDIDSGELVFNGAKIANRRPTGDVTVPSGYSVILSSDLEIPAGFTYEIESDGILEII